MVAPCHLGLDLGVVTHQQALSLQLSVSRTTGLEVVQPVVNLALNLGLPCCLCGRAQGPPGLVSGLPASPRLP